MEPITLSQIDAIPFSVPLIKPVLYGKIERVRSASVLLRLKASDGTTGYGEACCVPQLTAESAESVVSLVELYARKLIVGTAALDWRRTALDLRRRFPRSFTGVAAIETAMLDLAGKLLGIPVHQLLGAAYRDRIDLCGSVSWNHDARKMADDALKKSADYKVLKVYVGPDDLVSDMKRLDVLRAKIPDHTKIMLDVKGLWSTREALSVGRALADLSVFLVEQPVAVDDHDGAVAVTRRYLERYDILTTADEAVETPFDVIRLARTAAYSSFNLGVTKMGGPDVAAMSAHVAAAAHIPVLIGSFAELGIATAAGLHLAAAIPELAGPSYLSGPARFTHTITLPTLLPESGTVRVPTGAGLGITVDEDRINALATAQ